MDPSIAQYLTEIRANPQTESVPFIGDLFDSQNDKFYAVTDKNIFVKSLRIESELFEGDVILSDVTWPSDAPDTVDRIIVGVEISIEQDGKQTLNGRWSLADCYSKVRYPYTLNYEFDSPKMTLTTCILAPLECVPKLLQGQRKLVNANFTWKIREIGDELVKIRNSGHGLLVHDDECSIQRIQYSVNCFSEFMRKNLSEWGSIISHTTWATVTVLFIKLYARAQDFANVFKAEAQALSYKYSEKRKVYNLFNSKNVDYITSEAEWNNILRSNRTVCAFLFYNDMLLKSTSVLKFFWEYQQATPEIRFCAVDLELTPNELFDPPPKLAQIREFYNGRCEINDVMQSARAMKKSLAKLKEKEDWIKSVPPKKRALLNLQCPGHWGGSCPPTIFEWYCENCEQRLYYSFDKKIYCNQCGSAEIEQFTFRCNSQEHEDGNPPMPAQLKMLDQLTPMKERYVLILGQSGVGKSTWINAISNYMLFATLEEAEKFEVVAPIPAKFILFDNNYKERVIYVGSDDNENLNTGESATQDCRCYSVVRNNVVINLIDSPGLCDVRGIEEDKKNVKKIIDYLRYVDLLHGICILLKPNETRRTVFFSYCLREILSNLHRSATNNLFFFFTNARQTLYRPGDSYPILKSELENIGLRLPIEERTYCMDNEAFRYLCAKDVKDIDFKPDEHDSFRKSWEKSVAVTNQFLEKISEVEPHRTTETVSLNQARKIIGSLTRPIGDITQLIDANIVNLRLKQNELKKSNMSLEQLRNISKTTIAVIEASPLGYPRTVCTSLDKCVRTVPVGVTSVMQNLYETHCHEQCYLKNVETEKYPNPDLLQCAAMNGGQTCQNCGCSWRFHMHITYEQVFKECEAEDRDVKRRLKAAKTKSEAMTLLLGQLEQTLEDHENEKKKIFEVAVKIAHFLRKNAISTFNDAFGDYLEFLIEQEEKRTFKTDSDAEKLTKMKEDKKNYEIAVDIFQKAANTRSTDVTPEEIKRCEQQLYNLPTYGDQFRQIMEVATAAEEEYARHGVKAVPTTKKTNMVKRITRGFMGLFSTNKGSSAGHSEPSDNFRNGDRGGYRGQRMDGWGSGGRGGSRMNGRGSRGRGHSGQSRRRTRNQRR